MTRAEGAQGIIHAVAAIDPHRSLIAAVIQRALADAQGNDIEAACWLCSAACRNLIVYLIPNDSPLSAEQAQAALIRRLPPVVRQAMR